MSIDHQPTNQLPTFGCTTEHGSSLPTFPPCPQVNSYLEFKEEVLPRIRKLGYNAIQIMAIQVGAWGFA